MVLDHNLWKKVEDAENSITSTSAMAVVHKLAKNCSINDVQRKSELIILSIKTLIEDHDLHHHSVIGLVSILESLSALICNARMVRSLGSHSLATRPARVVFGHFAFITCVKCIGFLNQEVEYVIVPLRQTSLVKKGTTSWSTPVCENIKTFSTIDEEMSCRSNPQTLKAFDIRKLFHCIFMIQNFTATKSVMEWIPHFRDPQLHELIILAQICLLSEKASSAVNLVCSARSSLDVRFRFLNSTVQLCQKDLSDALESLISIVRDNEDEFCRDALDSIDGVSICFLGGNNEFVSGTPVMLECVRLIIACLSASNFPVTARIALCQYAWPKLQSEFKRLVATHVTDNLLFEFEQFREQILQAEMVDTFLVLHRGGKLHMKLGIPQTKQGGRLLRGATRNLSITTERDLEDHIVHCGNRVQLLGPVLFSLITSDLYNFCVSNRNPH